MLSRKFLVLALAKTHSAITELSPNNDSNISGKDERKKKLEAQVAEQRASESVSKVVVMVKERRKPELTIQKEMAHSDNRYLP